MAQNELVKHALGEPAAVAAAFISVNRGLYVWAISVDRALETLKDKGLVYQGALERPKSIDEHDEWEPVELTLFRSSQFGDDQDRPIKKSDGSWTYFAADTAYHMQKLENSVELINIWGADHSGTVKRTQAAVAALAGRFPPGFRFGTVTSATQVEGSAAQGGRGPSIWDTWSAVPGRILDGSTPAVASDHYRRHSEDVALLARLGASSYRFSVSWSRVQPAGRGAVNAEGLDFYDRLVDELLESGVAPMATLLHHDLPQALEDDGGWLHPDTAERFAEYAAVVGDALADRVQDWVPISEPAVMTR